MTGAGPVEEEVGGTTEGVSRVRCGPQLAAPLASLNSWLPGPSLGRRPPEVSSSSGGLWAGLGSWLRRHGPGRRGTPIFTPRQCWPYLPLSHRNLPEAWNITETGQRRWSRKETDSFLSHERHRSVMFGSHLKLGMSKTEPTSASSFCLSLPAGQQHRRAGDFLDSFRFS